MEYYVVVYHNSFVNYCNSLKSPSMLLTKAYRQIEGSLSLRAKHVPDRSGII